MRKRHPPDFGASFLDLLCSGLGGVALLVVIFAAMQTMQAENSARASARILVVEVVGGPSSFRLGREVSVSISHPSEGDVALNEVQPTGSSKFRVVWPERGAPTRDVAAVVTANGTEELTVRVWLQSPVTPPGADATAYLQGVSSVLKEESPANAVEVKVYWLDQKDNDSNSQRIKLFKSQGYTGQCLVTYEKL